MPSQEELVATIIQASKRLDSDDPALNKLASYLYIADSRLKDYLENFETLLQLPKPTRKQLQERGKILEQVTYLVFSSLKGVSSIKSFQSAGSQYDLVVSGDDVSWHPVCKQLYMDISQRDIVIEAKAKISQTVRERFNLWD